MTDRLQLHTSAEIWGALLCAIFCFVVFLTRRYNTKAAHSLMRIMLCAAALMGFDALGRIAVDYSYNAHTVARITFFLTQSLGMLIIPLISEYVSQIIYARTGGSRIYWSMVEWIFFGGGLTALIANEFYPFIYYIAEDGAYIPNPYFFWIPSFFIIAGLMMTFSVTILYFKYLHIIEKVAIVAFLILPMLTLLMEIFLRVTSYTDIMIVVSVIIMFIAYEAEYAGYMVERERQLNEEKLRIINNQMQPHFIFNSLALIRYLCQNSPDEAVQTINDFSACMRRTTDFLSENECISVTQELDLVKHYLAIQNKRFDDGIKIEYYITDEGFDVPPFSIQTLVENALHHGLLDGQIEDANIVIRTGKKGGLHIVTVIDNGVGFDPDKIADDKNHVGMKNTQNRLEVMCKGELEIDSTPGGGTTVRMIIPA